MGPGPDRRIKHENANILGGQGPDFSVGMVWPFPGFSLARASALSVFAW